VRERKRGLNPIKRCMEKLYLQAIFKSQRGHWRYSMRKLGNIDHHKKKEKRNNEQKEMEEEGGGCTKWSNSKSATPARS
jgi:hypothetical protein